MSTAAVSSVYTGPEVSSVYGGASASSTVAVHAASSVYAGAAAASTAAVHAATSTVGLADVPAFPIMADTDTWLLTPEGAHVMEKL